MFSTKHSFADMKECNLKKKQTFTKNRGLFAKMQKRCFFLYFLFFGGFVFVFSVFLCFFLCKGPKRQFSSNVRVFFSSLFPQKACFKILLFFLFCFLFCFPYVFPFTIPFFLCFLSIIPFLENIIISGFFCFPFSCLFLS